MTTMVAFQILSVLVAKGLGAPMLIAGAEAEQRDLLGQLDVVQGVLAGVFLLVVRVHVAEVPVAMVSLRDEMEARGDAKLADGRKRSLRRGRFA